MNLKSLHNLTLSILLLISPLTAVHAKPAASRRASFSYLTPVASAAANASPECENFASLLSILSAPCNGVSVTSVTFNPTGRTVVSGTTNTVGVVYRYPNAAVAPDGTIIDALVTVQSYNNNQDTTPTTFRDADLPGATAGFDQNLQPSLQNEVGTFSASTPWIGNITYRIQFVDAGQFTPRVISVAATTLDNDGSNACGNLREQVTYSAGYNQILTSTTTNQTVAGATVTGPTTIQTGIGVGADYSSSALYVNVTEFSWTQGWSTAGNCVAGAASEVRYGSLNLACQINFGRNFSSVALSGNVLNDTNGLTDLIVNGTGTNAGGLFASLVDSNGFVVASVPVGAGGAYSFAAVVPGSYTVRISTTQGVESSAAPAITLPAGWVSTGENIGVTAGNDGTVNGSLPVTVAATPITNANFGIEQRPVANNNTAATQANPGGTTNLTVPPTTFTATDTAPGTVGNIRILSFPIGVTSIKIGTTTYTSATFPSGGVTIATNAAGNPLLPITVDPFDGNRNIDIPYVAIDNAGVESSSPATARLPVSAGVTAADASIGGRVLDRYDRGASRSIVTLTDESRNVKQFITNPFGYYHFDDLQVGKVYVVNVRHKLNSYQPRAISLTDSLSDVDFQPEP